MAIAIGVGNNFAEIGNGAIAFDVGDNFAEPDVKVVQGCMCMVGGGLPPPPSTLELLYS
jgi:hypothetical protein